MRVKESPKSAGPRRLAEGRLFHARCAFTVGPGQPPVRRMRRTLLTAPISQTGSRLW